MGIYDLQSYWKLLKVKVENHTIIANSENKQKSKISSLISLWLGGIKVIWVKQVQYYNLILNKNGSTFI